MAVTRTSSTGFFGNLLNSFLAIPIGILLFLASFFVLFKNEGRPNMGKIAERTSVAAEANAAGHEGEFVSVTGTLESGETVGDPLYVSAGPYISISRNVEVYAWVEHSSSQTRDKLGGGTETTTTYTYSMEWTSNPQDSGRFEEPAGHQNLPQRVSSDRWSVSTANIGVWSFDASRASMPGGSTVDPSTLSLAGGGKGAGAPTDGNFLYIDGANPANPQIGDHRISFSVLEQGIEATAFGRAQGGTLVPHNYKGDKTFFRVFRGDRTAAIETLKFEHKLIGWGLRILGFFMMWIGMGMVFSPLHAIAGILPFAKKATKLVISLITFPIALVLTGVTIVVSMIAHSIVALIIVALIVGGIGYWLWKGRKKGSVAA